MWPHMEQIVSKHLFCFNAFGESRGIKKQRNHRVMKKVEGIDIFYRYEMLLHIPQDSNLIGFISALFIGMHSLPSELRVMTFGKKKFLGAIIEQRTFFQSKNCVSFPEINKSPLSYHIHLIITSYLLVMT